MPTNAYYHGRREKKSLEAFLWLGNFCAEPEKDAPKPSLPEFIHFHHSIAAVQRMVQALILSKYQWTPQDVEEMDEQWLDDILTYATCENIIRSETKDK